MILKDCYLKHSSELSVDHCTAAGPRDSINTESSFETAILISSLNRRRKYILGGCCVAMSRPWLCDALYDEDEDCAMQLIEEGEDVNEKDPTPGVIDFVSFP